MKRFPVPFIGGSNELASLNIDAQKSFNCFTELDTASPRAPAALYGCPGLELVQTIGTGPILAMQQITPTTAVVVSGADVYLATSTTALKCGSLATTASIGIANNGVQILIVTGGPGYVMNSGGGGFAKITDPQYPVGAGWATYQDGWFIVGGIENSQKFYINENPYDSKAWNGLDVASAEGNPDFLLAGVSDHRELWLFGSNSIEVWADTGNATFPFERQNNIFIEVGCANKKSVAKLDNTLFWLGSDSRGQSDTVYRSDGYTPQRISTHSIERQIKGFSKSNMLSFAFRYEGHAFYVISFPSNHRTFVYDVSTDLWHERGHLQSKNNSQDYWKVSGYMVLANDIFFGSATDGKIYRMDSKVYTYGDDPILKLRRTTASEKTQNRAFYSRLQVDLETGVGSDPEDTQIYNPELMLRWSNDGGHTWSNILSRPVGKVGEYSRRVIFNRLGTGRNRLWEISMSDPVKFVVMGGIVDADVASS